MSGCGAYDTISHGLLSLLPYSGPLPSGQPSALRVAVQTGSYELDNLGDLAMLEVLIDRLREHYPGTSISVFARDAERVRSLGRAVKQIPVEQKREWAMIRSLYLGLRRVVPSVDWVMRRRRPWWYESILRMKARALVNLEVLENTDMLIVSGGGFITDVFPGQAWPVLERMAAAIRQNVPFALRGQGIGPLRDPALLQKAPRHDGCNYRREIRLCQKSGGRFHTRVESADGRKLKPL